MNDNKLFIEWKYNGQTVFKSLETDYHCGSDMMEIKRNKDEIWFKLRPKTTAPPYTIKIKHIPNLDYLEVWTCDGKYYQHDLNFSHLIHRGQVPPVQETPTTSQPVNIPNTGIPTPPSSRPSTPKPVKPSKDTSHIDELKKKQAEGKLKPSEIKKQKLAKKNKETEETKKTLKEWLEENKISEGKYELLNEWLNQDEVFSLAEINAKYWELKDKE